MNKRPSHLRPITLGNPLGSRRFWDLIDAIGRENERVRRAYKTDAQWELIFETAENCELPDWVWFALLRQRRRIEESQALDEGPEDRRRLDLSIERSERAQFESDRLARASVAFSSQRTGRGRQREPRRDDD